MCTGVEPIIAAELFGGAAVAAEVGAGALALGAGAGIGEAFLGAELFSGALGGSAGLFGAGAGIGEFFAGESLFGAGALESLGAAGGVGELFSPIGTGAFEASGLGWGSGVAETGVLEGIAGGGFGGAGLGQGFAGSMDSGNFVTNLRQLVSNAKPVLSAVSGVTGLQKAGDLKTQATQLGRGADPWGTSGGRALADAQLRELLRNPSGVAATDPAYKLRIQGAQRATAGFGQDSGAMSVAGAGASTDWYNQRVAQLASLAGTGINPGTGAQIQLSGTEAANNLTSSSLGSLGYGVAQLAGTGAGLLPAQQQQLLNFALMQGAK